MNVSLSMNGMAGAFFTPSGLARDFAIEVSGQKIIDLCAGIGSLAFAVHHHNCMSSAARPQITCVEINPDYVEVGKKVLPEATWIVADVLDLPASLTGIMSRLRTLRLEGSSTKAMPRAIPAPNSSTT